MSSKNFPIFPLRKVLVLTILPKAYCSPRPIIQPCGSSAMLPRNCGHSSTMRGGAPRDRYARARCYCGEDRRGFMARCRCTRLAQSPRSIVAGGHDKLASVLAVARDCPRYYRTRKTQNVKCAASHSPLWHREASGSVAGCFRAPICRSARKSLKGRFEVHAAVRREGIGSGLL